MRSLKEKITGHRHYTKAKRWGVMTLVTGSAQTVVQGLGFLCGILVVRLLPVEQYAFYTLANTMLGAMTILADGGISSGVLARGGQVWRDRERLGAVMATGLQLRRRFAVWSALVCLPLLGWLLWDKGAGWLTTSMVCLSVIPAFYAALSDTIYQVAPKLHQAVMPLQRNQMEVGAGRLLASGALLFVFPWAFVAILAAGIPRLIGNIRLRRISVVYADPGQRPDPQERTQMLKLVRRILPGSIFYCISGQITVWLISVFGTTAAVAQVGALGRFSLLLTLGSSVLSALVFPAFAKLPARRGVLAGRLSLIMAAVLGAMAASLALVYFASDPLLWILGESYRGLDHALVLSMGGACISTLSGIFFGLGAAREWPSHPALLIGLNVAFIVSGALLFDVSTLAGVLWFNIYVACSQVLANAGNLYYKISRL